MSCHSAQQPEMTEPGAKHTGGWFNIKMPSYQYRKSHCGDKTILRPSYLHNGISYTGKMTSLYWIRAQVFSRPLWIRWLHCRLQPQAIMRLPSWIYQAHSKHISQRMAPSGASPAIHQALIPLKIFRLNSKFDQNLQCSCLKCALPITTKFCTRHDSYTVVTCAKYCCDRLRIF